MVYTITVGEKPSEGFFSITKLLFTIGKLGTPRGVVTDPGVSFWEKIFIKFSQKNS